LLYSAHRAVVFAIAQLSCLSCCGLFVRTAVECEIVQFYISAVRFKDIQLLIVDCYIVLMSVHQSWVQVDTPFDFLIYFLYNIHDLHLAS